MHWRSHVGRVCLWLRFPAFRRKRRQWSWRPVVTEVVIGAAGNVARNIAALGAQCLFVGVVGVDDTGRGLMSAPSEEPEIEPRKIERLER